MGQTDYKEFFEKIGVTIPEPRSMEGFGMELPAVYLSRCLDIIVPATEEYIKKLNSVVVADFMTYIQGYKGFSGKLPIEKKEEAGDPVKSVESLDSLRGEKLEKIIADFLKKNPGISRFEAIKQLNISSYRFDRVLHKLESQNQTVTVSRKNDNAKKVTAEIIGKFFEENPTARSSDAVKKFNVSISSVNRRRKEYAKMKKEQAKASSVEQKKPVVIEIKATDVKNEETPVKEVKEVAKTETTSYQKGGFMADIRSRYENRDKEPLPEEKAVEKKKSAPINVATKKSGISFNSFSLLKFYSSMSTEDKAKAKEEDWGSIPADVEKVEELSKAYLAHGVKIRKRDLTKIEYLMLLSVFNDKNTSFTDKRVKYSEYLV